jgi:hypothetical protein
MRWFSLACLAALLLAGCNSPPEAPADATAVTVTDTGQPVANVTAVPMRFQGEDLEAELAVAETFALPDSCILGFPDCPAASSRSIDLDPIIPTQVPVELSISLSANSNFDVDLGVDEATSLLQYSREYNGGDIRLDVLLVRGAAGHVTLDIVSTFTALEAVAAQSAQISGTVHSVSRGSVVPPYMPVSVRLEPGDVVSATGDGLEQFVAFPPTGPAIRATQYPFELALGEDSPAGDYFLVAVADEAVRLAGPNRTLTAHRLAYVESATVPVPTGQPANWEFPIEGHPVRLGVVVENQETVPDCCGAATYMGPRHVRVTSPDSVEVLVSDTDCLPLMGCPVNPLGTVRSTQLSAYLDEHLVTGTYAASVTVDQGNNLQAYAWAIVIE